MTRERLPPERPSITRDFSVPSGDEQDGQRFKIYFVASFYSDGRLAELFIYIDRKNDQLSSLLAGMLDTIATTISIGLQHGVPLAEFLGKLRHSHFGPSGKTGDERFPTCTSLFDLLAQWLGATFPEGVLKA